MHYPDRTLLDALTQAGGCLFHGGLKGLEKESLRVAANGKLSQKPHPPALGSALTHPYITTDYSEALLEFITPPRLTAAEALEFLCDLQRFTYANLDDEILWATSMPCGLGKDEDIPIADYGTSNIGWMKHVYRRGLGHRYGRKMQTISGVHFNFSLPENFWPAWKEITGASGEEQAVRSAAYFGLIRNFQRYGWLIPYLFGASPAVCRSFFDGRLDGFEAFDKYTAYLPYATSLRMSDIGYKNKAQAELNISFNNLEEYVASLQKAIETPWPPYRDIGVKVNGEYRQLNDHILQIENEYYSFIRPKNIIESGEKPTLALKRRGVKYIEVRALDVSAFDPAGVNLPQLNFLEVFLVFCLLSRSENISPQEQAEIDYNQSLVAVRGREPGLKLRHKGKEVSLHDWALELIDAMTPVAQLLDACETDKPFSTALEKQKEAARNPDLTPSARMLAEMRERGESFSAFALRKSQEHAMWYAARPLPEHCEREFSEAARDSLEEQAAREDSETLDFDTFLDNYFKQNGRNESAA